MITLALRLQDDFPQHYPLFATRTFTYNGETYPQPQHAAVQLRGHGRHQDRLHPRLRLQPRGLGAARAEARDRRRVRRRHRASRNAAMRTYPQHGAGEGLEREDAPAGAASRRPGQCQGPAQDCSRAACTPTGRCALRRSRLHRHWRLRACAPCSCPALPPVRPHPTASRRCSRDRCRCRPRRRRRCRRCRLPPAGAFQIQIGAFQSQTEAERQLASIRERAGALLSNHSAVTTGRETGRKDDLSRALCRLRGAGDGGQRLHRTQAPQHQLPGDGGGVG